MAKQFSFVDPFYTAETLDASYEFLQEHYLPLLPGRRASRGVSAS